MPSSIVKRHYHCQPCRPVHAFSIGSFQSNTCVIPPRKIDVFRPKFAISQFRRLYLQGDIPISRSYEKGYPTKTLNWKKDPRNLDVSHYLPVFFEGLCECEFPYREFAIAGTRDLLFAACPDKILNCVPQLILPIKKALNTRNPCCIIAVLQALQQLMMAVPCIGQALVPYYRQILPILNLFRNKNICLMDQIEFNQMGELGDIIDRTLQMLECCGGPNAYINLKYMVPTYESCVMN